MKNDENTWHGTVGKNRVIQPRLEKEEQTLLFDALELRRSAPNNATFAESLRKQAEGHMDLGDFPAVNAWLKRCTERPAFEIGRTVCAR